MINYQNFSNESNSFGDTTEENEFDTLEGLDELDLPENRPPYTKEEEKEDKMTTGKVDRDKIYLRSDSDKESEALDVLNRGEELLIDHEASTEEWFRVCTASGREGYVMKSLIAID